MDNPLILAVETSGRTGSAAVGTGDNVLAEGVLSGHLRHGAELLTCCQGLLEEVGHRGCDINHIYISAGPGSFTGVRIATTMAKIFALANGAKIAAVSTLDVISANVSEGPDGAAARGDKLAVILDAKRGQFYVAVYDRTPAGWSKTLADCLMKSSEFCERFAGCGQTIGLLGEGLVYYRDAFKADNIEILDEAYWCPHARNVYRLGRKKALAGDFADPLSLVPFYLRRPEAVEKQSRRQL